MIWDPPEEVRARWTLAPDLIDADALRVIQRLRRFGYTAFLVGGCVRDLYLGIHPKDFDVVTSARPNELRRLFRNCRIIGRRFRLAHIVFGPKVVEVSTFRSLAPAPRESSQTADFNVYGSPREDALRRDFTVNGLFYSPETREIIDHVGGIEDLRQGRVRCIGPPQERLLEDPVRMIRALKLAGRLGFTLDPSVEHWIGRYREEVASASPARVLEEVLKILACGASERVVRLLWRYGLFTVLLPEIAHRMPAPEAPDSVVWRYLRQLDDVDRGRRVVANSVLLGSLLTPVLDPAGDLLSGGAPRGPDPGSWVTRTVRHSAVLRHLSRHDLYHLVEIQAGMARLARLAHAHRTGRERVLWTEDLLDVFLLYRIGANAIGVEPRSVEGWEASIRRYRPELEPALDAILGETDSAHEAAVSRAALGTEALGTEDPAGPVRSAGPFRGRADMGLVREPPSLDRSAMGLDVVPSAAGDRIHGEIHDRHRRRRGRGRRLRHFVPHGRR